MKFPMLKEMAALFRGKKSVDDCIEKKKRRGISLAEMLLALAIVGILAAILMPVLKSSQPDRLETLHKKANYIVEHVVADIAFDEDLYPETTTQTGLGSIGTVTVNGVNYAGEKKFCELFASRVNKAPGSVTNCSAGKKTFTSIEGIDWYLPVSTFDGSRPYEEIKFDVNGSQSPNCQYNETSCPKPDTFVYYLKPNGKLYTNTPTGSSTTYCINLMQTGPGSVMIKPKTGGSWSSLAGSSCGKAPGEYMLKATPAAGYEAKPWSERNLTITNADVDVNIEFQLIPPPVMRDVIITKIRNYSLLGGLFNPSNVADGTVKLGDQEITFSGSGTPSCYSALDIFHLSPGCKIYTTTVSVESGQYGVTAVPDAKSAVDKVQPTVVDVTSTNGSAEISFIWNYLDNAKYNVTAPIIGDHYCNNGINVTTVSGTVNQKEKGTPFTLTLTKPSACDFEWVISEPSVITSGNIKSMVLKGSIPDHDIDIPVRMIAPGGAHDTNPVKHKVIVNQHCPDGSAMCAAVTGTGEYPEGTGGIVVKVSPYEGLSADWTEQTVSVGTEDVILDVTLTEGAYCINTTISGPGNILPSKNYCGLTNGTYTITAVPATGYGVTDAGWVQTSASPKQYQKSVTINDASVNESVSFIRQEDNTYCVNLTINCPYADPSTCGYYTLWGVSPSFPESSLTLTGNIASICGLTNGTYIAIVHPDTSKASLKGYQPSSYMALIENANYENTIDFERIKAPLSVALKFKLEDGLTVVDAKNNLGTADIQYILTFTDSETGVNVEYTQTISNAEAMDIYDSISSGANISTKTNISTQDVPIGQYTVSSLKGYRISTEGVKTEISSSVSSIVINLTQAGATLPLVYTFKKEETP